MAIAPKVLEYLTGENASFETVAHPKTFSSRETADAAHIFDDHLAKGVVLKDHEGYLLVVIPANEWISIHQLKDELDRDLQLATENEIERLFADCLPGAVPPLGEAYGIETIVDEALISLSKVYFEAGDHEQLILVNSEQFHALVRGQRHGFYCEQK
jgi:Ala-tRNA(Pro) deacylase